MKMIRYAAFALILAALPLPAADAPPGGKPPAVATVRNVGVEEFDTLRAEKNAVVLDVRTEKEFKAGHIPGAINLDFNSGEFAKKFSQLDKGKTYLVHCASGARSAKASSLMTKGAFANVVNLDPGFRGWEKAGKAVKK